MLLNKGVFIVKKKPHIISLSISNTKGQDDDPGEREELRLRLRPGSSCDAFRDKRKIGTGKSIPDIRGEAGAVTMAFVVVYYTMSFYQVLYYQVFVMTAYTMTI